jgi:ATP-dependent Lon protease
VILLEQNYTKIEHELPLIPLRGLAIFPYMILNFDVGREMSLKALDAAMQNEDLIFLTSQKAAETDEPTEEDFYHVGTVCKVKQMIKLPGDTVRVLVEGIERAEIDDIIDDEKFMKANVVKIEENHLEKDDAKESAYKNLLTKSFNQYIEVAEEEGNKAPLIINKEEGLSKVTDLVASFLLPSAGISGEGGGDCPDKAFRYSRRPLPD